MRRWLRRLLRRLGLLIGTYDDLADPPVVVDPPTFDGLSSTPATVVEGDTPTLTFSMTAGDDAIDSVQGKTGSEVSPSDLTAVDSSSPFTQAVLYELDTAGTISVFVEAITSGDGSPFWLGPESLVVVALVAPAATAEADDQEAAGDITLEWTHSQASGRSLTYDVQVQVSGGDWSSLLVDVSGISGLSRVVSGGTLSAATEYEWRVRANNGTVTSDWSTVDAFTTLGLPQAPTGLAVDQINSTNSLLRYSWTDNADGGKTLSGVQVYAGTSPSPTGLYDTITPGTETDDITTGFSTGDIVYVRLRNAYSDGSFSAYTADVPVFVGTPQSLGATGDADTINWSATPSGSPEDHAVYYNKAGTGAPYPLEQESPDGSASFGSPTSGSEETQWGRMVAIKSGVESPYSNEANATSLDTQAPGVPTLDSIAALSASSLRLTYTLPAPTDINTLYIERSPTGSGSWTQIDTVDVTGEEGNTDTYDDTGLSPGTEYFYRVRVDDDSSNVSAYSSVDSATTTAVSEPTFDSLSSSPATVVQGDTPTLTFAVTQGTDAITSVQGKLGPEEAPTDLTGVDSSAPYEIDTSGGIGELQQAETIPVFVEIVTGGAGSPFWKGPENLVVAALAAPTLTAEPDDQDAEAAITLEYTHSQASGRSLTYDIQVQLNGGDWSSLLVDVTGNSGLSYEITASTLTNENTYQWRARANNGTQHSDWSTPDTFSVTEPAGISEFDDVTGLNYAILPYRNSAIYSDDGTTIQSTNGGSVQRVVNEYGSDYIENANPGTTQPTLLTSGQNSKPALRFDGDAHMTGGTIATTAAAVTHIIAFTPVSLDSDDVILAFGNNARVNWDGSEFVWRRDDGGSNISLGGSATGFQMLTLQITATTFKFAWDDDALSADQGAPNGAYDDDGGIAIAANVNNASPSEIDVSGLLTYDAEVSQGDLDNIYALIKSAPELNF